MNFQIVLFLFINGLLLVIGQGVQLNKTLELEFHRSAIYLSTTIGSTEGVIYMFEKINEKIGAYALIHYNQNIDVAKSAKTKLETAIRSKVKKGIAKLDIDWKSFLVGELMNVEYMVRNEDVDVDLTIAIVIADKNKVTKVESAPKNAGEHREVMVNNDSNKKLILIEAGFRLAFNKLENMKNWNEPTEMIIDMVKISNEKQKAKGMLLIDMNRAHHVFFEEVLLTTPDKYTFVFPKKAANSSK